MNSEAVKSIELYIYTRCAFPSRVSSFARLVRTRRCQHATCQEDQRTTRTTFSCNQRKPLYIYQCVVLSGSFRESGISIHHSDTHNTHNPTRNMRAWIVVSCIRYAILSSSVGPSLVVIKLRLHAVSGCKYVWPIICEFDWPGTHTHERCQRCDRIKCTNRAKHTKYLA